MKPKDLKSPFSFRDRRPCILERIFYVPTYYDKYKEFSFPFWQELFGNDHPVHIEYCSGNGEWILERAKAHPEVNWVAVEMKFERVRKIHSKRINRNISNLLIVCGEAQVFTREYVPENSVETIYVNFPDPWPKDRHAKHRLIQAPFMRDVLTAVRPGGNAQLVSDAKEYVLQMQAEISQVSGWKPSNHQNQNNYGSSYFDRLWRSLGREIYYLEYLCEK
ncbi:tRNA (guanine(46)-N(7))-methyltransferase TrmB [Simkania negevensis]|uniref:tRNA (guanine-N(7)-)-methyltransferase n=1 Tax=Simkania negevensis (strain ATCC VR-1471 / DSM 27360 / Z) TaxID=331113 RepID=F8L8L3_SIMNZ|nr:tRNA (guanine(46)-N(7))-methyltransferase TrmB [Simkania negevensis]CCB89149.1 tRNA (guanine-N(7)-)-methyltransferase [Simkania negevensis Z]